MSNKLNQYCRQLENATGLKWFPYESQKNSITELRCHPLGIFSPDIDRTSDHYKAKFNTILELAFSLIGRTFSASSTTEINKRDGYRAVELGFYDSNENNYTGEITLNTIT